MGQSWDWQTMLADSLSDLHIDIFNPRRTDWDSSWSQSMDNKPFVEQVNWELDHIEKASLVVMYLDPTSKSPVSLLELGMLARSGKVVVCCPDGFWRKGNVEIVCNRHQIPMLKDLDAVMGYIRSEMGRLLAP